jgi:hypothetical protein
MKPMPDYINPFFKRHLIFIIFICLFITNSHAQSGGKKTETDTSNLHIEYKAFLKSLQLEDLPQSTDSLHIRFSTEGQIVDTWTKDGISFKGLIKNYAYPNNDQKQKRRAKIFFNTRYIDSAVARAAFTLVQSIERIPTEDSIKGWSQGFDGALYSFERSTRHTNRVTSYWSPDAQDSNLVEAKIVQHCVDSLYSLLKLQKVYDSFIYGLPLGAYSNGSAISWVRVSKRVMKRANEFAPDFDYLQKMKDTINNYLSDTLSKILKPDERLDCWGSIFLKFSSKNRLLSIKTNERFMDKEDKRDYLYRKRRLKAAFKHIRMDFVHTRIGYRKKFSYSQGKASIYD